MTLTDKLKAQEIIVADLQKQLQNLTLPKENEGMRFKVNELLERKK